MMLTKLPRVLFTVLWVAGVGSTGGCASDPVVSPAANPAANEEPSLVTVTPKVATQPGKSSDPGAQLSTKAAAQTAQHPLQQAGLTLHIGKTGALARLGHNHLITAALTGFVWLDSSGDLHATAQVPVTQLVVDDLDRRAAAVTAGNTAYASVPTGKNIDDTRTNMLSAAVLDAEQFPNIEATVVVPAALPEFKTARSGSLNASFALSIRNSRHTLPAVVNWQRIDNQITWNSRFAVSHQDFGMTPFSALGGALRVADSITVELHGALNEPFSSDSE